MAVIGMTTHVRGPIKVHVDSVIDSALAVVLAYSVLFSLSWSSSRSFHNLPQPSTIQSLILLSYTLQGYLLASVAFIGLSGVSTMRYGTYLFKCHG